MDLMNRSLIFPFTEERSDDGSSILVPRAKVYVDHKGKRTQKFDAIIDSGSEITLIPYGVATYLNLPQKKRIRLEGISGVTTGILSETNLIFNASQGTEILFNVPILIGDWPDIILGRKAVFDAFRITFTQLHRLIEMQRMKETAIA